MPIRLVLGHSNVLRAAGAHVSRRMMLQLTDEVLQVSYPQRAHGRSLVIVHVLRGQGWTTAPTMVVSGEHLVRRIRLDHDGVRLETGVANVLLRRGFTTAALIAKIVVIQVIGIAVLQRLAQQLFADAAAARGRIPGARAPMRSGIAQRLEDVLVVAVEALQRALHVQSAAHLLQLQPGLGQTVRVHLLLLLLLLQLLLRYQFHVIGSIVLAPLVLVHDAAHVVGHDVAVLVLLQDAFLCEVRGVGGRNRRRIRVFKLESGTRGVAVQGCDSKLFIGSGGDDGQRL